MKKSILMAMMLGVALTSSAQLKTTKLSIFKNGMFFQKKDGTLSVSNRHAYIPLPQGALLGTYWITPSKEIKITQIEFRDDTIKTKRKITNFMEMIRYNVGKGITVRVMNKEQEKNARTISGTLIDYYELNGIIRIKTNENRIAVVFTQNILDMDFDANMNSTFEADSVVRRGKIFLDRATDNLPVGVVSMQNGINWAPSYIIKLVNDKEARLMMKATIENTVEDINDAEIDLVVGNPQMYFGNQQDPAFTSFYDIVNGWGLGDGRGGLYKNMQMSNNTQYFRSATIEGNYTDELKTKDMVQEVEYTTEGEKNEDLYFYKTGKINLRKNVKNAVMISSTSLPYKDVYESTVWDVINYEATRSVYNNPDNKIDVFHSIKFTNKTAAPITTAPIFVLSTKEDPLAQDQINYTPVNADAIVHLSKAIDVAIKNKEEETLKAEKYKKYNRIFYDKVTLKGSIEVENFQEKAITLNLKKQVKGTANSAGNDGKIVKSGRYVVLNPMTTISWEVSLAPNEKKTISYEYDVLITAY